MAQRRERPYGSSSCLAEARRPGLPPDPGAECVYLHVLFPTDTDTEKMPDCSVVRRAADLVVSVGGLEYAFNTHK